MTLETRGVTREGSGRGCSRATSRSLFSFSPCLGVRVEHRPLLAFQSHQDWLSAESLAEYLLCTGLPFSIQFTSLPSDVFVLTYKIWNLSYNMAKLLLVHVNCLSSVCHIQSSTPINKGHSWKDIFLIIGCVPPPSKKNPFSSSASTGDVQG